MKSNQRPDKRIHIRKKVAGGTTGAVLGAVVGGPVGALVGGVIGTVVGSAAESGKLAKLTSTNGQHSAKSGTNSGKAPKRVVRKARQSVKRVTKGKARTRTASSRI